MKLTGTLKFSSSSSCVIALPGTNISFYWSGGAYFMWLFNPEKIPEDTLFKYLRGLFEGLTPRGRQIRLGDEVMITEDDFYCTDHKAGTIVTVKEVDFKGWRDGSGYGYNFCDQSGYKLYKENA